MDSSKISLFSVQINISLSIGRIILLLFSKFLFVLIYRLKKDIVESFYLSICIVKKLAYPGLFFVYFCPFLITISIIQIEKSIDGVIGFEPAAT